MVESTKPAQWRERRGYARAVVDAPTWVRIPSKFATDHYSAAEALGIPSKLKDLSFSGAKIVGSLPLGRVGERLELVLPVLSGEYISVIGQIVRVGNDDHECATAVRFSRVSVSDQEQLSHVMGILLSKQEAEVSALKTLNSSAPLSR